VVPLSRPEGLESRVPYCMAEWEGRWAACTRREAPVRESGRGGRSWRFRRTGHPSTFRPSSPRPCGKGEPERIRGELASRRAHWKGRSAESRCMDVEKTNDGKAVTSLTEPGGASCLGRGNRWSHCTGCGPRRRGLGKGAELPSQFLKLLRREAGEEGWDGVTHAGIAVAVECVLGRLESSGGD
jgi:hypothetical protein